MWALMTAAIMFLVGIVIFQIGRVQINATLLSSDGKGDNEVLAINAASAALATSDIPCTGEDTRK